MNTRLPIVYFVDKKNTKAYKYKITDFLKINKKIDELHLDYGVIYLGTENKAEHSKQIWGNTEEHYEKNKQFLLKIFEKNKIDNLDNLSFGKIAKESFYEPFKNIISILSFDILKGFHGILNDSFDSHNIEKFMDTIEKNGLLSSILEQENPLISTIKGLFEKNKSTHDERFVLFPTSHGKVGGSYVFVTKFNKSRKTVNKVLEDLYNEGHHNVKLEYASWLDGASDDGITIEQYISDGIFSEYVKKDKIFYRNNQGENYIGNYNDITNKHHTGLVLDAIKSRITLNGRKLTSKDIHSQTATINVLDKLLDKIGEDVYNKEFEISSYSKNKNEMLSKIVLPLIDLIEKETKKKLPLIAKGSIYDFYVKLNPTDIKISVIKKI